MIRKVCSTLVLLFTMGTTIAQNRYHCTGDECSFKPGEQVFVFGDNVKLRNAPKTESEVLELLKIGEWVEIIEKTEFSWPYRGFDSPFYKVKYDTTVGYILGGLLSLEKKTINGKAYFFAYSKTNKGPFLNIRILDKGKYTEEQLPLSNTSIQIKTMNGKGVPGLKNILVVDYVSEACGMEGGAVYFFPMEDGLLKIGELSQVSEAGIFYYGETFVFPDDEGGEPDKIIFKKETHSILDESSEWVQRTFETRRLTWANGTLTPNFREKIPEQ
ncbi:MAG: SH3 domain-containing protein [Bacteroidota bacterium]